MDPHTGKKAPVKFQKKSKKGGFAFGSFSLSFLFFKIETVAVHSSNFPYLAIRLSASPDLIQKHIMNTYYNRTNIKERCAPGEKRFFKNAD